MPKKGINLLANRNQAFVQKEIIRKLGVSLMVGLTLYIIFVVGLFSVSAIITNEEKRINKKIVQAEDTIKTFQNREGLEIALKERTKSISGIMAHKEDINEILSKVERITLVRGIFVDGVTINNGKISFSGRATDVTVIEDFLNILKNSKNDFSQIEIGPFGRTKEGSYTFSFQAVLVSL